MVLTSAWVSDSARRKQPSASCVKSTCSATAPPIGNVGTRLQLQRIVGRGQRRNYVINSTRRRLTHARQRNALACRFHGQKSDVVEQCGPGDLCGAKPQPVEKSQQGAKPGQ